MVVLEMVGTSACACGQLCFLVFFKFWLANHCEGSSEVVVVNSVVSDTADALLECL